MAFNLKNSDIAQHRWVLSRSVTNGSHLEIDDAGTWNRYVMRVREQDRLWTKVAESNNKRELSAIKRLIKVSEGS